ncbi:hypothetical protein U9M48_037161 [Paspalum notatum var. saurae]|uniref:DUF7642 domain-containing protein n=1 Tax=Paspalum notatum var. saurae TaxID=547442 RepID=A0AAQ3UIP9_PASNO
MSVLSLSRTPRARALAVRRRPRPLPPSGRRPTQVLRCQVFSGLFAGVRREKQQMEFPDEKVQVDALERQLLSGLSSSDYNTSFEDEVLHDASFAEMEDNFVKYQIAQWILLSVLLILAWGVGVLMLLYLPIRIYVCRRDFRSRKLYLTQHAVVYKVNKPVAFPCFGVFKKEKYCILPSISDVVVEQGYLQSFFGVYSIRIENIGVRKPPSDDVKITGVAHPHDFRKAVLLHLLNTRNQNFSRKASSDNQQGTSLDPMTSTWEAPHEYLMLEKLDEVEISVKYSELQALAHENAIIATWGWNFQNEDDIQLTGYMLTLDRNARFSSVGFFPTFPILVGQDRRWLVATSVVVVAVNISGLVETLSRWMYV